MTEEFLTPYKCVGFKSFVLGGNLSYLILILTLDDPTKFKCTGHGARKDLRTATWSHGRVPPPLSARIKVAESVSRKRRWEN